MQEEWDALAEKFSRVTDRLGMPIDPEIMETVIVLNALNIPTMMSCGGHLNEERGFVAPWIHINSSNPTIDEMMREVRQRRREAEELNENLKSLKEKQASKDEILAAQERRDKKYGEMHAVRRKVRLLESKVRNKLVSYLTQFYGDRVVPFDCRLILNASTAEFGVTSLLNQGAEDFYLDASFEIQQQKLAEYREEIRVFTTFLKSIYFSNISK